MNFFSKLVAPYRRGEKNFERGRSAELRGDFAKAEEYFGIAADAFDEHFGSKGESGARPSHLVMAGICYVRIGRNEDALQMFDRCVSLKEIPDAFLHAGYAAAKMGDAQKAMEYWKRYPAWYEQRIMHDVLTEQLSSLEQAEAVDLEGACEAIAQAVRQQDKYNENQKRMKRGNQDYPPNRGY